MPRPPYRPTIPHLTIRTRCSLLASLSRTANVDRLASRQFRAKTRALDSLSAHALLVGDLKVFQLGDAAAAASTTQAGGGSGGRSGGVSAAEAGIHPSWAGSVGVSVIETTSPACLLRRAPELATEMVRLRAEEGLGLLFAFVVDVLGMRAHLVVCGRAEASLAAVAYGGGAGGSGSSGGSTRAEGGAGDAEEQADAEASLLMDVGARVSRKKELLPPLAHAIDAGWLPPRSSAIGSVPSDGEAAAPGAGSASVVGSLEAAATLRLRQGDEVLIDDQFDGRLVRLSEVSAAAPGTSGAGAPEPARRSAEAGARGGSAAHEGAPPPRRYLRRTAMAAALYAAGVDERRAASAAR